MLDHLLFGVVVSPPHPPPRPSDTQPESQAAPSQDHAARPSGGVAVSEELIGGMLLVVNAIGGLGAEHKRAVLWSLKQTVVKVRTPSCAPVCFHGCMAGTRML